MEKGRMGSAPADLEIYELALMLQKTPEEIRGMPVDDRNMVRMVNSAQKLAEAEMLKKPVKDK